MTSPQCDYHNCLHGAHGVYLVLAKDEHTSNRVLKTISERAFCHLATCLSPNLVYFSTILGESSIFEVSDDRIHLANSQISFNIKNHMAILVDLYARSRQELYLYCSSKL